MYNAVTPMPNIILATSDGTGGAIYTVFLSDTQTVQIDKRRVQQIVGE